MDTLLQLFTFYQGVREALEWSDNPCVLKDEETGAKFHKDFGNNWLLASNNSLISITDDSLKYFLHLQDTFTRNIFSKLP